MIRCFLDLHGEFWLYWKYPQGKGGYCVFADIPVVERYHRLVLARTYQSAVTFIKIVTETPIRIIFRFRKSSFSPLKLGSPSGFNSDVKTEFRGAA